MTEHLPKPTLKWLFFGFRGRIARQSYIFGCVFQLVLLTLAGYQSMQGVAAVQAGGSDSQLIFAGFLSMAVMAFCFWSVLALSVKRMHDLDHPWVLIIVILLPAVAFLGMLYLMIRPGQPETNQYGPPPLGVPKSAASS